ncbi:hypothetical protein DL89DRAFT_128951 [Linderina pennispora]|uniref:Uncharacterized protein n=1 Tax=Linderina pennispora TaxID=61395 RepID=A0A1Y1WDH6_9FUNG|nr:uncharacterized protein DL89DRAFT_128951 [Linderina pennispora]ORX71587.1 hypothetical protein DL89DRAFT_128951 [Linderina pennispora]
MGKNKRSHRHFARNACLFLRSASVVDTYLSAIAPSTRTRAQTHTYTPTYTLQLACAHLALCQTHTQGPSVCCCAWAVRVGGQGGRSGWTGLVAIRAIAKRLRKGWQQSPPIQRIGRIFHKAGRLWPPLFAFCCCSRIRNHTANQSSNATDHCRYHERRGGRSRC